MVMNAREVIADELRRLGSFMPDEETDNILFRLSIRGFTIMSKEDAEPVATVYRRGNVTGQLVWTKAGERADLPNGTNLYAHPPESRLREALEEISRLQAGRSGHGVWRAVKIARAALEQEDGR